VFLWLTPERTGLPTVRLFLLRCFVTVALAALSYHVIESPIREGRLPRKLALATWANATVAALSAIAVAGTLAPSGATTTIASGAGTPPPPPPKPAAMASAPPAAQGTAAAAAPAAAGAAAAPT